MISWCDPDLIPKAEWDSEYAAPIMAGALWRALSHAFDGTGAGCPGGVLVQPRAAVNRLRLRLGCVGPPLPSTRTCPPCAGQMPDATAAEVRLMNSQLRLFHDYTAG